MERTELMELQERNEGEIHFKIVERIGVLSETKGWKKELNVVSWNKMPAKFDIREWDEYHEHMKKGITFTKGEIRELRNILKDVDLRMVAVPETRSRRRREEPAAAPVIGAEDDGSSEAVPF